MKTTLLLLLTSITLSLDATPITELAQVNASGTATLYKPADQISFTIGVYTDHQEVEEALKANNVKMERVLAALKQSGITKEEYQTGSFTVFPTYSVPPKNPPADWRATVTGYRVQNELSIKTTQMEHVGQVIDAVNKAGADVINDIRFSLKDKESAQAEAITAATTNALVNAKTLAESAHISLKRVLKVSLDQVGPFTQGFRGKMLFAAENSPTPIEAAQIEVTANVSVIYEID